MAKRPLGLAKSAKAKKQKQQEAPEKPTKQEADLNIDLDEEESDEALAEIYGLFKAFDNSAKSNPKMAMGIVHECDGLLRERQKGLPAKFHLCYGLALLLLSTFQDDSEDVAEGETPDKFIEAAIERLDEGLEEDKDYAPLKAAKAAALVAKIDEEMRTTKGSKKRAKVVQTNAALVKQAQTLAKESLGGDDFRTAEAVTALQQFAVSVEALPHSSKLAQELFQWSAKQWPKLEASKDAKAQKLAWQGLGELHLATGQNAFGEMMGDDDDEDEEDEKDDDNDEDDDEGELDLSNPLVPQIKSELGKAIEYLQKVQSDDTPQIYVQIAEAKISVANVTENESEEQKKIYAEAVKLLKKAQRLGAGDYKELIESLED